MSLPDPRLHTAMQSAVQKILSTVSTASSRLVDALGMLALSATSNAQRQSYMSAQFDLHRKLPVFNTTFATVLNEKVAQELHPRTGSRPLAATDWASLSLVGDSEVEEQVTAHRLGLEIEHECEWELRELDAYIGGYHLKELRKSTGKTQAEVAQILGVSQSRISQTSPARRNGYGLTG